MEKIMEFIFDPKEGEDGQDLQEEGLLFIKNLIFKAKNFGADMHSLKKADDEQTDKDKQEPSESW